MPSETNLWWLTSLILFFTEKEKRKDNIARRRKILSVICQLTNKSRVTTPTETRISNTRKSKYKHLTNQRIADIKVRNKCENAHILIKPATNSGVRGDNTPLYLDLGVSYYENV